MSAKTPLAQSAPNDRRNETKALGAMMSSSCDVLVREDEAINHGIAAAAPGSRAVFPKLLAIVEGRV